VSGGKDSVLVVGAGVIGIACAHYLALGGHRVTVIDQGPIGGGCSHGNCGHICASHVLPLTEPGNLRAGLKSLLDPTASFRIKPQWRLSMLHWLWQFARRCTRRQMLAGATHLKTILDSSMAEYEALFRDHGIDAQWQRRGLLYVQQTRRGMDRFAAQDAMLRSEFGIGARRLEGDELSGFDPALKEGLAGGFHYEGDASVRPDALTAQWSKWLISRGVRFEPDRPLKGIRATGRRIVGVGTDGGEMSADGFVFATGAWSSQLAHNLGCRIPVEPMKGYSVTMTSPRVSPGQPLVFSEHGVAATPFDDGYRLGSMMELAGFDETVPSRRIRQLSASAAVYLKEPVGGETHETWFGWRPLTPDSLPIIGRVPRFDNAFLATGHHMLGMSMAPATGRLVAELLGGKPPHIDPAPFSAGRFQR